MPDESFEDRPWLKLPAATMWDVAPAVGAEVMFRGRAATVVRVVSPGQIRGEVDLVIADGSTSDLHRSVPHAVGQGWAWPDEPPPSDPTPADRLRQAQAAGVDVPAIGSTIRLVCARPRSFRGTIYVGVPARVDAVHDAVVGPGWSDCLATPVTARGANHPSNHCQILLSARVAADADLSGLEGIEVGQVFDLISGPVGRVDEPKFARAPRPATEGWVRAFRETVVRRPQYQYFEQPCDRCGASGPRHPDQNMVRFFAELPSLRLFVSSSSPEFFVRTCLACAEEIGRFACTPIPPRPEPASTPRRPTQAELDDTEFDDEEDGDGA